LKIMLSFQFLLSFIHFTTFYRRRIAGIIIPDKTTCEKKRITIAIRFIYDSV